MNYLGDFLPCQTIYIPLNTFDSSGASVTMTGLAVTGIEIYKDGSMTQRSSDSGYALLDTDGLDLDSTTGLHGISIDLSDNTDSDFYTVGHDYWVQVNGLTIDSQSVSVMWGHFSICNRYQPGILLRTTIASVTDQTHIGLTTGPASGDWLNNKKIIVRDITSGEVADGAISDYTASGFAVVLLNALAFTVAVGDNVEVFISNSDLMATPADIVDEWETQSQADPTGFHVNVMEVNGTAQTANDNGADINAILDDTNELQTDWHDGGRLDLLLDGASAPTAAQVRAEIDSNSTQLAAIVENTGTTIPAILGSPADTDIATDISNISLGSGVTEAALIENLILFGD
jgi:hypothetical protein